MKLMGKVASVFLKQKMSDKPGNLLQRVGHGISLN